MEGSIGFNALIEKYEDLFAAGIVDPAKGNTFSSAECSQYRRYVPDNRMFNR